MSNCISCKGDIKQGYMTECKNCGSVYCTDCAKKTKRICPKCYSDLEFIG